MIDEKLILEVQKRGVLYRGTNDYLFNLKKEGCGFYYGRKERGRLVTSTSTDFFNALSYSELRTENYFQKPLVMKINPLPYIKNIEKGPEINEVLIIGSISFEDIEVIGTPEKFIEEFEKYVSENKRFKKDGIVDYYLNFLFPDLSKNVKSAQYTS